MTTPTTAYYIATVWTATKVDPLLGTVCWDSTRRVIRLQACGAADYEDRVRKLWPSQAAWMTFGPIGLSKVQG